MRARRVIDEDYLLEEVAPGGAESGRVLALHASMKARARQYAEHLALIAEFFREDPDALGVPEDADLTGVKVAVALRATCGQAWAAVLDAHTSVELMPLTYAYLARGELPEAFHHYMLRHVRRLSDRQKRFVDEFLAEVELPSIPRPSFEAQVRLAVKLAKTDTVIDPPTLSRSVELVDVSSETGTASLYVTGPILEIKALAHRLDVGARTVQQAQRAALKTGEEIPFDIDQDLASRRRALSLATLRYAILTHSILDIDPVQETRCPYKILVTVPVTTMLGIDDAPAMLEGLTPIPAEQARHLAAEAPTWTRILTDPVTGAYLPATANGYQPTAAMRLQLRLRHPVCAVPGCDRATLLTGEDDHIVEYDHHDPARGGPTTLANLHRLCWQHHQTKTAGDMDPTRDAPARPHDGPRESRPVPTGWLIDGEIRTRTREHTDLLTPHTATVLDRAWHAFEHAQRQQEDAAREHRERRDGRKCRDTDESCSDQDPATATATTDPGPPPY